MKFVLDDKRKHQLVGLVVIISIAVVLMPAMIKKTNSSLDDTINLSVRLPANPHQPVVHSPKQADMFESVKVAQVDLSDEMVPEKIKLAHTAKAVPIKKIQSAVKSPSTMPVAKKQTTYQAANSQNKSSSKELVTQKKPIKGRKIIATSHHKPVGALKKHQYAVQIASFAVENNAKSLVKRLHQKGYKASYNKNVNKRGPLYKVIVGSVDKKEEAAHLQKQLVESLHLKGLIIKTGVS